MSSIWGDWRRFRAARAGRPLGITAQETSSSEIGAIAKRTVFALALGISLVGCGSGLSGSSSGLQSSFFGSRCGAGLATEDITGRCRTKPATMGALAAGDDASLLTAVVASAALVTSPAVQVAWQPFAGDVSGYEVFFGRSVDTANLLLSDLPADSGLIDPRAPTVTYDATRDLGLNPGDTACFRIYGYDFARTLSDQSVLVCKVV